MSTHWQINPDITLKVNRGQPQVFELKTPTKSTILDLGEIYDLKWAIEGAISVSYQLQTPAKIAKAIAKAISERTQPMKPAYVESECPPEVVTGAKRLQRDLYKRRLGPWEGVVPPWSTLSDECKDEFLHVATLFHTAEQHQPDPINRFAVVAEVAQKLVPLMDHGYSISELARWVESRYDNYLNPHLDPRIKD